MDIYFKRYLDRRICNIYHNAYFTGVSTNYTLEASALNEYPISETQN